MKPMSNSTPCDLKIMAARRIDGTAVLVELSDRTAAVLTIDQVLFLAPPADRMRQYPQALMEQYPPLH